jgi:hypothetical protein
MFDDDAYELSNPDGDYSLTVVEGGWRIIDSEQPDRFKTVFSDKAEAADLCNSLNAGQAARNHLDDMNGEARYYSD